jgi:hypothetical protein
MEIDYAQLHAPKFERASGRTFSMVYDAIQAVKGGNVVIFVRNEQACDLDIAPKVRAICKSLGVEIERESKSDLYFVIGGNKLRMMGPHSDKNTLRGRSWRAFRDHYLADSGIDMEIERMIDEYSHAGRSR